MVEKHLPLASFDIKNSTKSLISAFSFLGFFYS